MKKFTYRRINFTINRTHLYGHYTIDAQYKGHRISATTTDSEIYDWCDDDSNKAKYSESHRAAYRAIVDQWCSMD